MDEMFHVFSPSHMFSHINHNHISYLSQIYSLGFTIRVWGFLPPSTIPYGIVDGADTIHPAFIHKHENKDKDKKDKDKDKDKDENKRQKTLRGKSQLSTTPSFIVYVFALSCL
jgi:hypothetical protein